MMKILMCIILFFNCSMAFGQINSDPSFKSLLESTTKPCEKPVFYLVEKEIAPCTGYLLSPAKEYELRLQNESHKHLKELASKQSELLGTMNKRVDNLRNYNDYITEKLQKQQDNSFWKNTLYFALGVVITGVIAKNVQR